MINSKVSFQKHVDALLKTISPAYALKVSRETPAGPGYRLMWLAEDPGPADGGNIMLMLTLDQYKEGHDDLRAGLERRQILDMMGLLGKPQAEVVGKYTGLNAELNKYLGGIFLPKKRFVTDSGNAGDGAELCMMHVKLLNPKRGWYEIRDPKLPPEMRNFRLDLILVSWDL